MGKYRALRVHLMEVGIAPEDAFIAAPPIHRDLIEAVHDPSYVAAFLEGRLDDARIRRIGFPWSIALVRRTLASAGGTYWAATSALEEGLSGVLAGGTHHAHRDFGAGFCVFNDIVIAARAMLRRPDVGRILVMDVDVHQGDGTAALCAEDPRVTTCSVHGARNFPLRKQASDLDVGLPDGTGDEAYLEAVRAALATCLERGPYDLAFVQAGVDGLAEDRLGRLALTHRGLEARDALVLGTLRRAGIPTAITLGGGYAEPIEASIRAHAGTYRVATGLADLAARRKDARPAQG